MERNFFMKPNLEERVLFLKSEVQLKRLEEISISGMGVVENGEREKKVIRKRRGQ